MVTAEFDVVADEQLPEGRVLTVRREVEVSEQAVAKLPEAAKAKAEWMLRYALTRRLLDLDCVPLVGRAESGWGDGGLWMTMKGLWREGGVREMAYSWCATGLMRDAGVERPVEELV